MPGTEDIDVILAHVKKLNKMDQFSLLKRLTLLVGKTKRKKASVKLSSISGIGSPVWSNMNIGEYIDGERGW